MTDGMRLVEINNMKSGIYLITINNYKYIGMSKTLSNRKASHYCELKKNKHKNQKMQNVYNRYKTFNFEILEHCEISELCQKEVEYIQKYNTLNTYYGLNLIEGGSLPPKMSGEAHPFFGVKRGEQTKEERYLKSKKNLPFNKDDVILINPEGNEVYLKDYCSIYEFAKTFNLKASNVTALIKANSKTFQQYSYLGWTVKGRKFIPINRKVNKYKHIKLISGNGQIINLEKYTNIKEFAKEFNLDNSTILKVLKGKLKSSKGWRIYNE